MKLRPSLVHPGHRREQRGSAVIMLLGIIALLLGIVAFNHNNVSAVRREVRMIEKQQIHRMDVRFAITNQPTVIPP